MVTQASASVALVASLPGLQMGTRVVVNCSLASVSLNPPAQTADSQLHDRRVRVGTGGGDARAGGTRPGAAPFQNSHQVRLCASGVQGHAHFLSEAGEAQMGFTTRHSSRFMSQDSKRSVGHRSSSAPSGDHSV